MGRFPEGDGDGEYAALDFGRWEHNSKLALTGRRGQKVLRELREALLALPERRLIRDDLAQPDGAVCSVGAWLAYKKAQADGSDVLTEARALAAADPEPWDEYALNPESGAWEKTMPYPWAKDKTLTVVHGEGGEGTDYTVDEAVAAGMTKTLAWIVGSMNDHDWWRLTPEERWAACLQWVESKIQPEPETVR